jgi:hypothetical protein
MDDVFLLCGTLKRAYQTLLDKTALLRGLMSSTDTVDKRTIVAKEVEEGSDVSQFSTFSFFFKKKTPQSLGGMQECCCDCVVLGIDGGESKSLFRVHF